MARRALQSKHFRRGFTTPRLHRLFPKGEVFEGDALKCLEALHDGVVSLVFLDPPFNLGKTYGTSPRPDLKSEAQYCSWFGHVLDECVRVLAPGGSLFLYHLPRWGLQFGHSLQERLTFRHWIAVSMKNGFVRGRRLYPAHYALLYFTKGEPGHFHRPRLKPETCRHCGGFIRDYGGYKQIVSEKGINLADIWTDISPVRHASTKTRKANELPRRLTDRVLDISGAKKGLFLDPFAGSGSAVLSALEHGMRFIACDKSVINCRLISKRLEKPSSRPERGAK